MFPKTKTSTVSAMVAALGFWLAGCASPEARVNTAIYDAAPRTATTRLDVFQPGEKPTKSFHVIGLLTVKGAASDEASCVQGIVVRARKLGADGLVILEAEAPNKNIAFKYGLIGPSPDE